MDQLCRAIARLDQPPASSTVRPSPRSAAGQKTTGGSFTPGAVGIGSYYRAIWIFGRDTDSQRQGGRDAEHHSQEVRGKARSFDGSEPQPGSSTFESRSSAEDSWHMSSHGSPVYLHSVGRLLDNHECPALACRVWRARSPGQLSSCSRCLE